ncbi:MAG TPA: DegT/DnrJ/EryC1/StrS aminotransferase family protein [Patescibacteria group bacterium]|nr:DegT/DnrJ/EryC1/StrS aminotransferase family protein [Patescibacteria group bacterium]
MGNTIALGVSPNLQTDDIILARTLLFAPWKWKNSDSLQGLSSWFKNRYHTKDTYFFNAGRAALYFLLVSAGVSIGDEVLVQSFTCVAAIEPVLWVGATPLYVDLEKETLNMSLTDARKKITASTKVIILQHTFGVPADLASFRSFADANNILLIEDCAHALGATSGRFEVGTVGDAAFFSFGRDKVVSSVFGGSAVVKNERKFPRRDELYTGIPEPSFFWVLQQLIHPVFFSFLLPLYHSLFGKLLLVFFQKLRLLSLPYAKEEYRGKKPGGYPKRLSPALARLALHQLEKVDKMNSQRKKIASSYGPTRIGAIYLRYPLLTTSADLMLRRARERGIILGRWYSHVIDPKGVSLKDVGYKRGSCKEAETVASQIINLPTYPRMSEEEVKRVVGFITSFKKTAGFSPQMN